MLTLAKSYATEIRTGATTEASRTIVVTAPAIGALAAGFVLAACSIW